MNSQSGMTHHGRVIQLQGFDGILKVVGNTFQNNILGYGSCSVFNEVERTKYNQVSKYAKVTHDTLQIKSLIVVRDNSGKVEIANNTFTNNSVVKGLIYIENRVDTNYVLNFGNIFENTATFFDASEIFIRTKAST